MKAKSFNSKRLTSSNMNEYLEALYPQSRKRAIKSKSLKMKSFLQNDFGLSNDCTLTSIMTCLVYHSGNRLDPNVVYGIVEKYAKNYGYTGTKGTNPLVIKRIYDASAYELRLNSIVPTSTGYLKNVGYNYEKICELIGKNIPIIISINNDGRNYYRNHSMTIMGYITYRLTLSSGKNVLRKFLRVYDNWYDTISYIDYETLSYISSINY